MPSAAGTDLLAGGIRFTVLGVSQCLSGDSAASRKRAGNPTAPVSSNMDTDAVEYFDSRRLHYGAAPAAKTKARIQVDSWPCLRDPHACPQVARTTSPILSQGTQNALRKCLFPANSKLAGKSALDLAHLLGSGKVVELLRIGCQIV